MANYPYIIASFPDLLLDFERHPLDVDSTVAEVKGQLSEKDGRPGMVYHGAFPPDA